MLKIGWKYFENRWPCFEVVENLSAPLGIVRSCWEIFGNLRKSSGISSRILGSCRKFSEVFQNLQQSSEAVGDSSEIQVLWRRKNLTFY